MSKDIRELEQTLASNPRDVNAFEALEERLLQTRRWQELLRLYLDRADLQEKISRYWDRALQNLEKLSAELEEVPDRAEVMVGIGQIWEEQLKRRDQAMVYYQRAFKVWPYKTRALDLARNIYAQQNNWKLVVRLYELQLQVAREPRDQAQIYRDIARIQDQHLGDLNAAAKLRQKADDLYPEPIADPVTTPFARPDEREPVTAPIPAVVVEAAPVELPPAEEVTVEVSAVVAEVAPEVAAPEVAAPEVEAPVVAAPEVAAPVGWLRRWWRRRRCWGSRR
jgi:hypothetical protein